MKRLISILLLSIVTFTMVWAQNTLYHVECSTSDVGAVYALPRYAAAGTTVALKAVPGPGHMLAEFVVVKSTDFTQVEVTEVDENIGSFVMPACDVTVTAMYSSKPYTILIDQTNQGYGIVFTSPQGSAPAGMNVKVTFLSNYMGDGGVISESDLSNVIVEKVNGGGFSDNEPWQPANAPRTSNNGNLVEVTQNRYYEYEFIMPASDVLITPVIEQIQSVTLQQLADSGEVGKIYRIGDEDLAIGHYAETEGIIFAKDNNHAEEQVAPESTIDYNRQAGLQRNAWDHSNWLAIDHLTKGPHLPHYADNQVIRNIRGKLVDATNLQLMAAENPVIAVDESGTELTIDFTPNNFVPANYCGTQVGNDGNTYFFVAPAANEYARIHWAKWNAGNQTFDIIPSEMGFIGINTMGLQGSFPVTLADNMNIRLVDGAIYTIDGVAKILDEASGELPFQHYSVYILNANGILRGDINADGVVDVSDMNIVINIMLGKAQASNYPGNADVDNNGTVDVGDVNIIINIMLGK